jgi:hypothetical protein
MSIIKTLQIIKIEGNFSANPVACYIYSGNKTLSIFNMSSTGEKNIRVHSDMTLEIKLKDSYKSDLGVAVVPVHLLKNTKQWLHLQPPGTGEALLAASGDVPLPRILLRAKDADNEDLFDSCFVQPIETYESFASELAIVSLIDSPCMDFDFETSNDTQKKYKKQCMIIKILAKQLETLNDKSAESQKKIEILESKLIKSTELLSHNIEVSNEREKCLLDLIQAKENEIHQFLSSNMALQGKLRVIENEKDHLIDQINRMEFNIKRLKETEKELEIANSKINKSETAQEYLNKSLLKLSKAISEPEENCELKNQLILKTQEIQILKNSIEEIKKSGDNQVFLLKTELKDLKTLLNIPKELEKPLSPKKSSIDSEKPLKIAETIDRYLLELLRKLKLAPIYSKLNDFTYQIKGKVINLALCIDGVYARAGCNLISLEEHLEDILEQQENPRTKTEESFTSRSNENIQEKFNLNNYNKTPSQKTFLKSTKSSINKVKPIPEKSPLRERNRVKSIDKKPFR